MENKEIYQNKSSSYITGSSNGTLSTDVLNTQCEYNILTDRGDGTGSCGGGASTTGNIYGIYDMSGGAWEYMMANMINEGGTSMMPLDSGFTSYPLVKYYDKYSYNTLSTNRLITKLGDATREVGKTEGNSWYSDSYYSVRSTNPWVLRGAFYNRDISAGIFALGSDVGSGNGSVSTRVVILPLS